MLAHMCKAERREGLGREKPNTLPKPLGSLPKLLIQARPLNWIGWGNALQSWLHSFPQGRMQEGPVSKSYYPPKHSFSSEVFLSHSKGIHKIFQFRAENGRGSPLSPMHFRDSTDWSLRSPPKTAFPLSLHTITETQGRENSKQTEEKASY